MTIDRKFENGWPRVRFTKPLRCCQYCSMFNTKLKALVNDCTPSIFDGQWKQQSRDQKRSARFSNKQFCVTMVLTDRQRNDLHAGMYEYLLSRPGEAFQMAAKALEAADPEACARSKENGNSNSRSHKTPLLEKKWTAIPRLQKKVLEMERAAAQNAKIYAHRSGGAGGVSLDGGGANGRRMLPRLPSTLTLKGHQQVVTSVVVHPVFTVVVSGSEDGTIKVRAEE